MELCLIGSCAEIYEQTSITRSCDISTVTMCHSLVQVTNESVGADFFSSSAAVSFTNGQTTANAVLLLWNDVVPEGNETFIVEITGETPENHS